MKIYILLLIALINHSVTALAGGGTWSEFGDAPSFPDGQAQVTRGAGDLTVISGSTTSVTDTRDAYCVKITNPNNFQVTSDETINGFATADFDTRLYLFDKRGKPLLFNDDTSASTTTPFPSTLESTTNDGSGYVLTQPGEYILVVAGFADKPLDNIANVLFAGTNTTINSASPNAGHFGIWENITPATGNYFLTLQGASFCQDKLDVVGTAPDLDNNSQLCSGDSNGGFDNCHNDSISSEKTNITTGYLDDDAHLDVIFDVFIRDIPSICLGDGKGGYKSCSVYAGIPTNRTNHTVIGDINNDGMTDAVFVSSLSANNFACLGNGTGSFTVCNTFPNTGEQSSGDVDLAYMNGDRFLDVVIPHFSSLEICFGDGAGGFGVCGVTTVDTGKIAISDFNGDNVLDVVAANDGNNNSICLNDGTGVLTCSAINVESNRSSNLDVGDLDNDGDTDIVFANVNGTNPGINKVCLNDGSAVLTCNNVSGDVGNYPSVKLGLLNDDNFLDAVFVGGFGTFTRICMGNGDGTFNNCVNDTSLKFLNIELGEFGQRPPDAIFSDGFE